MSSVKYCERYNTSENPRSFYSNDKTAVSKTVSNMKEKSVVDEKFIPIRRIINVRKLIISNLT